ncbi:MAG: hypothetical protein GF353_06500 [Candidatus Lokiarchaeota archaeon]|nr:hypothetical protein [Candidatus Lokiarchaeota archaeon]
MNIENIIKTIIMNIILFILVAPFVYPELSDIDFHFKPILQRDIVKSNFEIENSKTDSIRIPSYNFVIRDHYQQRKNRKSTTNDNRKKKSILSHDYKKLENLKNDNILATKTINPNNHNYVDSDTTNNFSNAMNKADTLLHRNDSHNINKEFPKQNDKRIEAVRGLRAKLLK